MRTKKVLIQLVVIQILALSGFLYSARAADNAMDKTGIGDYQKFAYWSQWAGAAYHLIIISWVIGLITTGIYYFKAIENPTNGKTAKGFILYHLVLFPMLSVVGYVANLLI
jgi:hypothetical protein